MRVPNPFIFLSVVSGVPSAAIGPLQIINFVLNHMKDWTEVALGKNSKVRV